MIFTKLHIPQTDERIIHRTNLFETLNKGIERKLILVSATAGYGKTTLISDWINQNKVAAAWCSMDERDNDPFEFLKIVLTAINRTHEDIGKSSLELLKTPGTANIKYIIELFINDLIHLNSEMVLVLDDLHLLENKHVFDILSLLIEYKPKNLRLIISTRSDPPIALARLRSQNEILEMRSKDLSFTHNDISFLFNKKLKLGLTENDLNILEQKTEGWIAGLQLTAITIQGNNNISEYLKKMKGDNRYIMDYLMEEVLNNQSEEITQFLLYTSVLERLSGSLCDALLSKNNSQQLLEALEKSNVFLISLDNERKWYRYHHLFVDLLQNKLKAQHKSKIPELHNNASRWFELNDLPQDAIEHSLRSGNSKRAVELINPIIEALFQNLDYYKIFKFGRLFSKEDILDSHSLCIIYAWTLAFAGKFKEAEYFLKKLYEKILEGKAEEKELVGKIKLTYAYMAIATGAVNDAFENSEQALKYLPDKADGWKVWAYILNGEAHLLRFELDLCIQSYEAALAIGKRMNSFYQMLAVGKTAYALLLAGRYNHSFDICTKLLETFKSNPDLEGYKYDLITTILNSIIGFVQIERNELEKGFENIVKGYTNSQKTLSVTHRGYCAFNYAEALYKLGKRDEAISELNKLEVILENDISVGLNTVASFLKNKLLIENEEYEKVALPKKLILEKNRNNIFPYYHFNISKARNLVATFQYNDAIEILGELAISLKRDNAMILLIEAELLKAIAFAKLNEKDNAIQSVANALLYAQPEELIRSFIIEGEEVNELIKELKRLKSIKKSKLLDSISSNFLNKLIEAFEKETKKPKVEEVISTRELDILQLIAKELTNQEIANELFISITTVKTHVRNILLKLEAKNRSEAVLIAKEKGILLS